MNSISAIITISTYVHQKMKTFTHYQFQQTSIVIFKYTLPLLFSIVISILNILSIHSTNFYKQFLFFNYINLHYLLTRYLVEAAVILTYKQCDRTTWWFWIVSGALVAQEVWSNEENVLVSGPIFIESL